MSDKKDTSTITIICIALLLSPVALVSKCANDSKVKKERKEVIQRYQKRTGKSI